jgi:YVTN family beta-propeller protein
MTVIDAKRLAPIKTIKLGDGIRPMGQAMAKDGKHLYVSTGRSKMVYTIDTGTNTVAGMVETGQRPWGIGISPDGSKLFTANGPSGDVSIVDIATDMVTKKIMVGRGPWGLAVVAK